MLENIDFQCFRSINAPYPEPGISGYSLFLRSTVAEPQNRGPEPRICSYSSIFHGNMHLLHIFTHNVSRNTQYCVFH